MFSTRSRARRLAPQQPTAATTAAAVAPQLLRDEHVWRFLLELWEPCLDQGVVCKLLCVSQSMERLVHSLCAGKLSVVMSPVDDSSSSGSSPGAAARISWPSHAGPCRWLAKHMRLLHSCTVAYKPQARAANLDEGLLGTALVAAGGGSLGVARSTRAQAAAGAAAITAAAAAAAAAMGAPQALQHLAVMLPTRGSIICSLSASSMQLTSLELCLTPDLWRAGKPAPGLADAVASLTTLQALTVQPPPGEDTVRWCRPLNTLLQGLWRLRQLTRLDIAGYNLPQQPHWPFQLASLRCSWSSAKPFMEHFTNLTSLQLCNTWGGLAPPFSLNLSPSLPRNLQQLLLEVESSPSAGNGYTLQPLVPLQSLTRFDYLVKRPAANLLQQLTAVTQLQELHMSVDMTVTSWGNPAPCGWEHLPALPLKSLSFTDSWSSLMPPGVFDHVLGTCTQLTRLSFVFVDPGPAASRVALLCGQLSSLPALEVLSVAAKGSSVPLAAPAAGGWEALAHACPQLSALRHLSLQSLELAGGAAAASLAAATQLTRLQLTHCGLDAAAQTALRAGFQGRVVLQDEA